MLRVYIVRLINNTQGKGFQCSTGIIYTLYIVNIKFNRNSTMGEYNCNMKEIWINTLILSILDMSVFKTGCYYTGLTFICKCD